MNKSRKTLFLVEDDFSERYSFVFLFQSAGYKVTVAKDSVTAVKMLDAQSIDLVILDMSLPPQGRSGGEQVLHKMSQNDRTENIPVIIITGIMIKETIQEKTKRYGNVVAFFEKPVENKKLLNAIKYALDE